MRSRFGRGCALLSALSALALACSVGPLPANAGAQTPDPSPTDYQYGAPNLHLIKPAPPAPPAAQHPAEPAHRSLLAASIPTPGELELSSETVEEGSLLTLLLVALLYLPVMIFNKTTEKNHAVIAGWFARPRAWLAWVAGLIPFFRHQLATLALGVLATTVLFAFIEPHFPGESGSFEYLLGLLLGFTLVSATFFCTWRLVVHRLEPHAAGHWVVYSPYILLAGFLVVMARLAHFLPGVVLGTVAEYEPKAELSVRTAGIRVAVTYGALLLLGLVAWFAWEPVNAAADKEGAGSLTLILDAMLAITFVSSLETVVFGLIPITFVDGHDLIRWHKGLWAAMWGASIFWFAVVVINPALGTYEEAEGGARLALLILLFSSLMIISLATWTYFRLRDARLARESEAAA